MRLVYFAPVPWESYPQRPHYMVRFFAEECGWQVLWVDPYKTRLPRWEDRHRRGLSWVRGPGLEVRGIRVLGVPGWPIEPLPGGTAINNLVHWGDAWRQLKGFADATCVLGIGRPTALAASALERLPHARSFYDAMDDFPEFYSGLSQVATRRTERRIARTVNRVFASSSWLKAKFEALGLHPELVMNACDTRDMPAPLEAVGQPLVFGYVGAIAKWFDWDLVVWLAHQFPAATVRLVGPGFTPGPRRLPPNVQQMPQCTHVVAIQAMHSFTLGLIPFRDTPLTRGVDPVKYYEYRAMGLPVLSTRFGEMRLRATEPDVAFFDEGPDAATRLVERRRNRLTTVCRSTTWSTRFQALLPGLVSELEHAEPPNGARRRA